MAQISRRAAPLWESSVLGLFEALRSTKYPRHHHPCIDAHARPGTLGRHTATSR